jgi:hypothetical protein
MGSDVSGPFFTVDEAKLVDKLLDSAAFKGSEAKKLAASAQAKVESLIPPEPDNANG